MNIFTPRTASIALAAAASLALLTAGTSGAAPQDVALSASVSGSTVTTTITNNTGADVHCLVTGQKVGGVQSVEDKDFGMGQFINMGGWKTVPVAPGTQTYTYPNIPVGEYLVSWGCLDRPQEAGFSEESWGTNPWLSTPTAEAVTVRVTPMSIFGS